MPRSVKTSGWAHRRFVTSILSKRPTDPPTDFYVTKTRMWCWFAMVVPQGFDTFFINLFEVIYVMSRNQTYLRNVTKTGQSEVKIVSSPNVKTTSTSPLTPNGRFDVKWLVGRKLGWSNCGSDTGVRNPFAADIKDVRCTT